MIAVPEPDLTPQTLVERARALIPRTDTGFVRHWTGANYGDLLHPFSLDNSYWKNMETSFVTSVIAVAACLVFGFPVAYFLAFKVQKLQNQIALREQQP